MREKKVTPTIREEFAHRPLTEAEPEPWEWDVIFSLLRVLLDSNGGHLDEASRDVDGALIHLVSITAVPGGLWMVHIVREATRHPQDKRTVWLALIPGDHADRVEVARAQRGGA